MAFKTAISAASGEQYKFEKVGQSVKGYYCGSFDHSGDYGDTKKHLVKTDKGMICIFGQRHLIQLLEGITIGFMVRITYMSTQASKKKGFNPMKVFQVEYDEDDRMDDEDLAQATAPAEEEPQYEEPAAGGEEPQYEEETQEEPVEEEPAPKQAAPKAAARPAAAPAAKAPASRPAASVSPENRARAAQLLGARKV